MLAHIDHSSSRLLSCAGILAQFVHRPLNGVDGHLITDLSKLHHLFQRDPHVAIRIEQKQLTLNRPHIRLGALEIMQVIGDTVFKKLIHIDLVPQDVRDSLQTALAILSDHIALVDDTCGMLKVEHPHHRDEL